MIRERLYNLYASAMTTFGDLYLAFEPPACRMEQIEDVMSLARPGDVLLRGYDGYVDGKFIPGEFSHSGLVINDSSTGETFSFVAIMSLNAAL